MRVTKPCRFRFFTNNKKSWKEPRNFSKNLPWKFSRIAEIEQEKKNQIRSGPYLHCTAEAVTRLSAAGSLQREDGRRRWQPETLLQGRGNRPAPHHSGLSSRVRADGRSCEPGVESGGAERERERARNLDGREEPRASCASINVQPCLVLC
jgi:hypothetical protein